MKEMQRLKYREEFNLHDWLYIYHLTSCDCHRSHADYASSSISPSCWGWHHHAL